MSSAQLPHVGSGYLRDNAIQEGFRIFSLPLVFQYVLLICLGEGQIVPIFLSSHWAYLLDNLCVSILGKFFKLLLSA